MIGQIKRHHIWYALGGMVGVVLLMVAGLFAYIWIFMEAFGACRDDILSSIPSPDGTKSVVIFYRNCNATVAVSSHASIAPTGEPFSAKRHPPFLSLVRTSDILASWRGNNTVEIALIPGGVREARREARVDDVQIEYK